MKFAAWKLRFKLKEVPIIFQDRTFGTSKMNKGIVKEGILGVLKLRWYSLFTNYRKRVKKIEAVTITRLHNNEMVAEGK
jgi:dolichol-phosphate mannosyltransferase